MAVDTDQKRRSMISFGGDAFSERVPAATDFDSAEDRAQLLFLYAGLDISGGSPTIPSGGGLGHVFWWLRRRRGH